MIRFKKYVGIVFFVCIFLAFPPLTAIAAPNDVEVYFNENIGFTVQGPEKWFLEMKDHPSPNAASLFQNYPSLFAFFTTRDYTHQSSTADPSLIFIFAHPTNKKSALEVMNDVFNRVSTMETIVDPPKEIKINNQLWASMTTKSITDNITYFHVFYITVSPNAIINIQASTSSELYPSHRKLIEQTVASVYFTHNKAEAVMNTLEQNKP